MYHIFFVFGLFAFSNGNQRIIDSKKCIFEALSGECGISSDISIRAEKDPDFCKSRLIKLVFTFLEERGTPCLVYGAHSKDLEPGICHNAQNEIKSYGNGTYMFSIQYNENNTRYFQIGGKRECSESCSLNINSSNFDTCVQPTSSAVTFLNNLTTIETTKEGISPVALSMIILAIILFLSVFLLFVGYKRYQKHRIINSKFNEIDLVPYAPSLTIFLVFLDQHNDHHKSVVLRFATYLKERFGFTILFELYNREKIYENPASWLEKSLSNSDVVLVIWSPGATERWNNPERYTDRLDLFTPVLKLIKTELGLQRNLSKFMFGYFEYCDSVDYPKSIQNSSIPCLKLMREFYSFCNKLTDLANKSKTKSHKFKVTIKKNCTESILAEATSLEASISKMSSLVQNDKTWKSSKTEN